jgi:hypothetical protein
MNHDAFLSVYVDLQASHVLVAPKAKTQKMKPKGRYSPLPE